MGIEKAYQVGREFEFDRAAGFCVALSEAKKDAPITGALNMAIKFQTGEILYPNWAHQQDGDGQRVFTGKGSKIRLLLARRPLKNLLWQSQKAQPVLWHLQQRL